MSEHRVLAPEACEIWCGDSLSVMLGLQVDHLISDPPYEDELHEAWEEGKISRNDGRVMVESLGFTGISGIRNDVAKFGVQATSGWLILFCLAEGVAPWRDVIKAAGAKYDTCLAWVKPDASPRFNGEGASRGFECAVTAWCGEGRRKWNGGGRRGVFKHNTNGPGRHGAHPTEKPVSLMTELVLLYTQPGDLVLDPFMGSGTTGVACMKTGRRFVGIEKDPAYFEIADQRLRKAMAQPDLFVSVPKAVQEAISFD